MPTFARVHGDSQPVFALDTQNGPIAPSTATAGTPVVPMGPSLDFFTLTANVTMANEQGVSEYVGLILQNIQQTATVAAYQVDGVRLSVAVYPAGAYTASTILAAANTTYTGFQLDSSADVGFKLATS